MVMKDERFLILFVTFCFVFAFIFGITAIAIVSTPFWIIPALLSVVCISNGILGSYLIRRYVKEN